MKIVDNLIEFFDRLIYGCAIVAAALIVVVMFIVCFDVITRYSGHPVTWTVEINEYLLLFITFLGAAYVLKMKGHVKVDIVTSRLSPKNDAVTGVISCVMGIIVSLVLIIYGSIITLEFFLSSRTQYTILRIPSAPLYSVIPIGGFLLLIQFLRGLYKDLQKVEGNVPREQSP